MKSIKKRRSSVVIMTKEARLLRTIRVESGHSIRGLARALGRSETFLRHIEKGRADFPSGTVLKSILKVYGVSVRQFNLRLKTQNSIRGPKEELI